MQLIEIFQTLSKQETAGLRKTVLAQNRPPLTALLNSLLNLAETGQPYQATVVFKAVFAQPFDKSKNYLLHNEVRNLKQITNRYLAQIEIDLQQEEEEHFTVNYLKTLSKKGLDEIFYAQWEKAFAKAEETYKSKFICELYAIKHAHLIAKSFQSPMPENEHIAMLLKWQQEEVKRLKFLIREQESEMAYLIRAQEIKKDYLGSFDKNLPFTPVEHITLADTHDPRSRYLELTREQFLYRGERRVQASRQTLALLHELDSRIPNRHEEEMDVCLNLSTALFSTKQYAEALEYLRHCVAYAAEHHVAQPQSVHEMQIRCHIMLGNYQAGIDHYYAHIKEIEKGAYYIGTVVLACTCYLFLNDTRKAIELNLQIESALPKDEFSKRYIFITAFMIDMDFGQASRELGNLKRAKHFNRNPNWMLVADMYDLYCDAMLSDATTKKNKLEKLTSMMELANPNLEIIDMKFLWLKRYVNLTKEGK